MIGNAKARVIFLGDGTVGTLEGQIEFNEKMLANIVYTPYKQISLLKRLFRIQPETIEVKNIPYQLITYKPYNQHTSIPKGGIFFIGTSSCGRDFLMNEELDKYGVQRVVLDLKKEIDIINSGLLDLPNKVKNLMEKDKLSSFVKKLKKLIEDISKIRKSLFIKKERYEVIDDDEI